MTQPARKLHELEIADTLDLWLDNAGGEHSLMLMSIRDECWRKIAYDAVAAAWKAGFQAGVEEGAWQQG